MTLPTDTEWAESIKEGDLIYSSEYSSDTDDATTKEYKVVTKYGKKSSIEGIKNKVEADIIDTAFPKVTIKKRDLTYGFCSTKREALQELYDIGDKVRSAALRALDRID
jgi:hypothetical protein